MSDSKFKAVGAQIPDRIHTLINLYGILRGESKSTIIRDGLLLWIEENKIDLDSLIAEYQGKLQKEYRRMKADLDPEFKGDPLSDFLNLAREGLEYQGLPNKIINKILEHFKP